MRGNPFIRLVVAFVVFLLLGVPVWRLTEGRPVLPMALPAVSESAPAAQGSSPKTTLHISVEYETRPTDIDFKLTDQSSVQEYNWVPNNQDAASTAWRIDLPSPGLETNFIVTTAGADNKRHALRVSVSGPDVSSAEQTLWLSNDSPSDVMPLHFTNKAK